MLEDTFEGVEEDDLEEAAQEEVEKVLFEVTKGTLKLVFFAFGNCSWIVSFLSASPAVGKGKGTNEPKSQTNRAYLGFLSMKHALGVASPPPPPPPRQDTSPSQGFPPSKPPSSTVYVAGTHFFTWVKRDKVE